MSGTRPEVQAPCPTLVSAEWVAERLGDASLRLVDASWYLPAAGRDARAEFERGHIPGAVHLDLGSDLADLEAPFRNTIARPEELARVLGEHGLGNRHTIVVYDHLGGYSAGRIWWTLRYLGHRSAAILDGGLGAWEAHPGELSSDLESPAPASFVPRPDPSAFVAKAEVLAALEDPTVRIVDARAERRFLGLEPESTPRRGHIPGACNVPYDRNLTRDPVRFRPLEELAALYRGAGIEPEHRVITMCGSGVTASLTAFVLTRLGYPEVAVYDGSWAEWGSDAGVPVQSAPSSTESPDAPA